MIGMLIAGSLAMLAVSRIAHRRWCGGGHHRGGHGGGWHGHHHWHRRHFGPFDQMGAGGFDAWSGGNDWSPAWSPDGDDGGYGVGGKRAFIRAVLRHVQATPAQER